MCENHSSRLSKAVNALAIFQLSNQSCEQAQPLITTSRLIQSWQLKYNEVMQNEFVAVQNVKDLQNTDKQWLENLLGHHLEQNQQVYIMVFTPGIEPDATAKRHGLAVMQQTWNHVEGNLQDKGVTGGEFDAAIDEAMQQLRRRDG